LDFEGLRGIERRRDRTIVRKHHDFLSVHNKARHLGLKKLY
jgi:hypothetical protein